MSRVRRSAVIRVSRPAEAMARELARQEDQTSRMGGEVDVLLGRVADLEEQNRELATLPRRVAQLEQAILELSKTLSERERPT